MAQHALPEVTASVGLADFGSQLIDINGAAKGIITCQCTPTPVSSVDEALAADTAFTSSQDLVAVVAYGSNAGQLGARQTDFAALPALQLLVLVANPRDSHGLLARFHLVTPTPTDVPQGATGNNYIVQTGRLEYDPVVDFQNNGIIGIGAFVADLNSIAAVHMSTKADYQSLGAEPPQIDTQDGNTTDILVTREAPLITAIRGTALVGPDLATITAPVIQKLVDADYNRASKTFTVFESLQQNLGDIKAIVTGLQQGIKDDVARHRPSTPPPGNASPASASTATAKTASQHTNSKTKQTNKTAGGRTAKHRKDS